VSRSHRTRARLSSSNATAIEWLKPEDLGFAVIPRTGVGCNRVQGATASLAFMATAATSNLQLTEFIKGRVGFESHPLRNPHLQRHDFWRLLT
jgi:hypothetical protein